MKTQTLIFEHKPGKQTRLGQAMTGNGSALTFMVGTRGLNLGVS